jgi:hypothetical protein
MVIFLAIAVAAVGIATLVVALSFGKRTEKHVSAMLDRRLRDSAAAKNEAAINDLRAELQECMARLDWLSSGLTTVPEADRPSPVPGDDAGIVADVGNGDWWGDD